MSNFKADPISRDSIRALVRFLKQQIGMEYELYFPVLQFAENVLPLFISDYQFEVVPIDEMGSKHGETYPSKNLIRIREDIYLIHAFLRDGRSVQTNGQPRILS